MLREGRLTCTRARRPGGLEASPRVDLAANLVCGPSEVGDAAGDIDGVIAQAFVVATNQGHLHYDGYAHLARGELSQKSSMEVVHIVVALVQRFRRPGIA